MATKKLNIDIIAKDKSKQALNNVQNNLEKTKTSVLNLRNALVGLGVGAVVKGFIDVGAEVQNLQIRFKFLFGSAEEGAKAFDNLAKFAGTVPFSLESIAAASGNLGVVAKDAEDLTKILEITGNVAAFTGLDFETTASQIQRSFAGGIAAADIFREKGLRSVLGFEAGAKVSVEETIKAFEQTFGAGGRLGNVTGDLAQTLVGQVSMVQDKFFNFQRIVSDQFIGSLTSEINDLNTILEENERVINTVAVALGDTLRKAIELVLDSTQKLIETFALLFETVEKINSLLPSNLTIADIIFNNTLPTLIKNLDDTTISISKTTEQLRLFRDADMESRIELEKFNEEMAKANSGFKEFAENAKDTHSIEPFVVVPVVNDEEDIFTQLQRIREKTGVGLMLQIKRQFRLELDVLREAREQGLLSEEEFLLQRERLNTLFEERITKAKKDELSKRVILEKQAQSQILDATGDALQKLSGINKTAFRAYQAFQIAMATVNTFRAVSNALQQFPFPLNLAVAAGEAARGFATVAAIRATAPPRIAGGRVNEGQPYMVGEGGKPELFVPQSSGTIVPNNQLTGTNVNITIMANDTEGFDDLLESRRATVVNIINDALNSQGKEAII